MIVIQPDQLPVHVLERILDIIHQEWNKQDSFPCFGNTSLVNRTFRHLSQQRMFGKVVVEVGHRPMSAQKLHDIMVSSPTFATNIRDLSIEGIHPWSSGYDLKMFESELDHLAGIFEILAEHSLLQSLRIRSHVFLFPKHYYAQELGHDTARWTFLNSRFKGSLESLLRRPNNMSSLEIEGFEHLPVHMLVGLHIKELTFANSYLTITPSDDTPSTKTSLTKSTKIHLLRITLFRMDQDISIFSGISRYLDFSHVKELWLDIKGTTAAFDTATEIINACRCSVESVRLFTPFTNVQVPIPFIVSCPELRDLRIMIDVNSLFRQPAHRKVYPSSFADLDASPSETLQSIEVGFIGPTGLVVNNILNEWCSDHLPRLDETLSRPQWKHLKHFKLAIRYQAYTPYTFPTQLMTHLQERGAIRSEP